MKSLITNFEFISFKYLKMKSYFQILLLGIALTTALPAQEERYKRQAYRAYDRPRYPTRSEQQITPDGVPIHSESYVNSRAASRTHPQNQHDHGLSLYDDFVNDPWKPTQDLYSLVSEGRPTRTPQRELRSGPQSSGGRDDLWNQGQGYSYRNTWSSSSSSGQRYPTTATTTIRPTTHNDGSGVWTVSSKSGDHITYVKERQGNSHSWRHSGMRPWREESTGVNTRSWSNNPPHGENGDPNWIVESRSDGHITYRRRNAQPPPTQRTHWQPQPTLGVPVQRLGHGQNEVLARVVKTGVDSGEDDRRRNQQGGQSHYASYKSMHDTYAHNQNLPGQNWKPTLQLKSGDSVSYRAEDGREVTFSRYRGSDSTPVRSTIPQPTPRTYSAYNTYPTQRPQHFEQEGDWRVVSKDDSHITWTRVGAATTARPYTYHPTANTYYRAATARPYYAPTTQSIIRTHHSLSSNQAQPSWRSGGPHYPMLHEKETDERARRLGASNTLAVVY